jgi:hypothetical protein
LAENVIPIAKGLQSVSYSTQYAAYSTPVTDFDQLILIQGSSGYVASFSPARGKNYILTKELPVWTSYAPFTFDPQYSLVTKGYVAGRTFIFYEGTKCVEWNPGTVALDTKTLVLPAGFTIVDIRGNSGASNYHLLFTDELILWSTPQNPLEFADVSQGAGSQIPLDLRGQITAVLPTSGGFLICTTQNIIGAAFTGDATRPFAFREVLSSAGIQSGEQITDGAHVGGHYAFGVSGLQQLTLQRAESVFSETTDFLTSKRLDYWETADKTIITTTRDANLTSKLRYLSSRYLAISYGATAGLYEFVLLYDTKLERWGKLRVSHVDCDALPLGSIGSFLAYFELIGSYADQGTTAYEDLIAGDVPISDLRDNFGFLQPNGTTLLLRADSAIGTTYGAGGTVIFGHVQVSRDRNITVLGAELDGLAQVPPATVTLLGSETGYTRTDEIPMELVTAEEGYAEYAIRYTAKNSDIAVEGAFELTNLILETVIHGTR